jgi:osmotically-inducible protein OsmY
MTAKRLIGDVACALGLTLMLGSGGCSGTPDKNTVNDAAIASGVRDQLVRDSELSGYPITVDVVQGNVTLRGQVDRSGQREAAEKLARAVDGVESVSNRIFVASTESPTAEGASRPEE